ncbi:hypothetical protein ABK040_015126 [Willaertia magna]
MQFINESNNGVGYPLRLFPGWFFGYKIDLTDPQWRSFRTFIPLLAIGSIIFILLSKLIRHILFPKSTLASFIFYFISSLLFVYFLHGNFMLIIVFVALVNYLIGRIFGSSKWNPFLSWMFNLIILFSSDYYDGYSFTYFKLPYWLDYNKGVLRWETYFNITFCRLISYNMDYCEQIRRKEGQQITEKKENEKWTEYRQRQESTLDTSKDFNLLYYFVYLFYIPLFIGGPVCSYTAFLSYTKYSNQQEVSFKRLLWLTFLLVIYIVGLEIFLHLIYFVGFNETGIWKDDHWGRHVYDSNQETSLSPFYVGMTGFLTLNFMYLKFLIIWRLFRLWALWDGVNPPENMNRCVCNNYLVSGFWRSWHRSLYLWIVRYLYVPLGGNRTRVWNIWIVFSFIALWHDLWWRWLAWAWINCALLILEVVVTHVIVPRLTWLNKLKVQRPYIHLAIETFTGGISIILLMIANLAIMHGFEDTPLFIKQLFWQNGGGFYFIVVWICLAIAVTLDLYVRDREAEKGAESRY